MALIAVYGIRLQYTVVSASGSTSLLEVWAGWHKVPHNGSMFVCLYDRGQATPSKGKNKTRSLRHHEKKELQQGTEEMVGSAVVPNQFSVAIDQ